MKEVIKLIEYAVKSRRAWWFTATSRTRSRFARTTLGSFWLGLSNLLSVAILGAVYGTVFRVDDFGEYIKFLGIGLVTWNTIASSVQSAPELFRANANNLKNTSTNAIFYTLEEWAFQVQTYVQSFGLVLSCLILFDRTLLVNSITYGLIPMANILLLMFWLPLIICILGTYFEDLYQLIPVALQLMFLLTPILYRKEALGEYGWIAQANPIYIGIENIRTAILGGGFNIAKNMTLLAMNLLLTITALALLEKKRRELPFLV